MKILIIAEVQNEKLSSGTLSVMQAGLCFKNEIDVGIVGYDIQKYAKELAQYEGVNKVLAADRLEYQQLLAENVAALIAHWAKEYTHILMAATAFGKSILPRIAALKDVAQVSEVVKILSSDTVVHPIYAGDILETVQFLDDLKIMTIRTTAFKAVSKKSLQSTEAAIEACDLWFDAPCAQFISYTLSDLSRPPLSRANIIISGGRGLQTQDNFKKLEKIAKALNAAIGGSRALVDAGFISNDYLIGQSGKVVAPDLYIAIGISGAIQHLAGMKDSKVIVAINNDRDAPIFQVADYRLIADLFTVLPELESILIDET